MTVNTHYQHQLVSLRAAAILTIEIAEGNLGYGHLSLWGQPTRLVIPLPDGQEGTVRFLSSGGESGEEADLDVVVDGTRRMYTYKQLSTEALALCADYANRLEDLYHSEPSEPESYREDEFFANSDNFPIAGVTLP